MTGDAPAGVSLHVISEPDDLRSVKDAVIAGLRTYNARYVAAPQEAALVLAVRDAGGALVGGLVGHTLWHETGDGWLYVHVLWVAEDWRGRGIGRSLLRTAEAEALGRGCRRALLDTYGFQARAFYEREGFAVYGVLEHYPPGSRRFSMARDPLPARWDP